MQSEGAKPLLRLLPPATRPGNFLFDFVRPAGGGADIIELGMPFTDPMADGPSIQAASQRALKAGQTLEKTLAMVARFRAEDDTTPWC